MCNADRRHGGVICVDDQHSPRRFPLPEKHSAGREKAIDRSIEHVIKMRVGTIADPETYLVGRDKNPPKR
jgi:hypothetical protein